MCLCVYVCENRIWILASPSNADPSACLPPPPQEKSPTLSPRVRSKEGSPRLRGQPGAHVDPFTGKTVQAGGLLEDVAQPESPKAGQIKMLDMSAFSLDKSGDEDS